MDRYCTDCSFQSKGNVWIQQNLYREWKLCSNRARRWSKCAISATHHVAVLSWDEIFYHSTSSSSCTTVLHDAVVRHCSTLSSTMMASLISAVARDWAPMEDSGDGCGRKSREGDEGDKNKDEKRKRKRRARRRRRPITFLSRLSRRTKRSDDDDDGDDAFRNASRCIGAAIAFSITPATSPSRSFSPAFHPLQTNILRRSFNCNTSMMEYFALGVFCIGRPLLLQEI